MCVWATPVCVRITWMAASSWLASSAATFAAELEGGGLVWRGLVWGGLVGGGG